MNVFFHNSAIPRAKKKSLEPEDQSKRFLATLLCLVTTLLLPLLPVEARAQSSIDAPEQGYEVVHVYPHDPNAFTQGLIYVDGRLFESTGRYGKSSLRMDDLETGRVLQHYDLPAKYFGEGLTDWGTELVQLTWKHEIGFVYDRFSFSSKRTFHYTGEGWGLTHDGKHLIMSDGSEYLRFLDPNSFHELRRLRVVDNSGHPIKNLNELEYIRGEVYANVWETDAIVRVSPTTGKVLSWIDLAGIIDKSELTDPDAVLNGIAYDATGSRIFVTGKLWPKLFQIRVVPKSR